MMDHCVRRGESCPIDIESCSRTVNAEESSARVACDIMEDSVRGETREYEVRPGNVQVLIETSSTVEELVVEKKTENEKRKTLSAKKPPKPPRPPRGLSLDAADQKLIKELAELATLKRTRIERMKALKKMKAAKSPSSSTSFSGSLFAMLCTVMFCVVIICQGMTSGRDNAGVVLHSSLVSSGAMNNSVRVVEDHINPSASAKNSSNSLPPYLPELVSGSDTGNFGEAAKS